MIDVLRPDVRTIVFCDLDGTLVLDNSFHQFLSVIWKNAGAWERFRFLLLLAPRILGQFGGGHEAMKRRTLSWFAAWPDARRRAVIDETLSRLERTTSAPVLTGLARLRDDGAQIILATAAPDLYAAPLAASLGASCLATRSSVGPDWHELLGTRKAEAAARLIEADEDPAGVRVVVLTDHSDDLPLLRLADEAVIQAPTQSFAAMAAELTATGARPLLFHIDPLEPQDGGGHWLWIDDRPWGPHDDWEVRTVLSKHRHALLYAGNGQWRRIGPGKPLVPTTLRRDCPRPPGSRARLTTAIRRKILRDAFGIYH
ncbi:HAD family hydrolase [Marivivens aquimaris]|uniref:HAD family hydrolase n=1 Tax=Marivivens aquimaris TaxID=2774876 RepID=UPI001881474A|nr:HAD family hydrolase [Marivivens aquimaris]